MVGWCSSAQLYFICQKRHWLEYCAGPHDEDQELNNPKTPGRFGLLLPLDFWLPPLSSGENWWETKSCLLAPMEYCKNQWVGANSPNAFVLTNLYLLAKIHVDLDKCGEKRLICGVPVILSSGYSSWVRLWKEQMGMDFLIWEALVLKYFIVLQNTRGCVWNGKLL